MHCLVAVFAQPGDQPNGHPHVARNFTGAPRVGWLLTEVDLLLGEPRGVFEGLLDVFRFEVRVIPQDFLDWQLAPR